MGRGGYSPLPFFYGGDMEIRQRTWGKFTDEQWAAIKKLDSEMDICSLDLSTQGEMVRAHVVTPQGEETFMIKENGVVVICLDLM